MPSDTRVHALLKQHGTVVMPGVFDTLSARIVERSGFSIMFVSGYAVAATTVGEPDLGLLTQMEMIDRARRICLGTTLPVIVDADTGYGNPLNVIRTVNELIAAGAAGCFLEDQIWPKKCGHMRGKRVIDRDEYIHKIAAANEARRGRDFFIVSRTDALAAVSMDEAVARMEEARAAGADCSFIEAPPSRDGMVEIGRRAPAPNVANMIEGGKTPVLKREELTDLGFHLVVYPLAGLYAAARGMEAVYGTLARDQTTHACMDAIMPFDAFNDLIGVEDRYLIAQRFGVK